MLQIFRACYFSEAFELQSIGYDLPYLDYEKNIGHWRAIKQWLAGCKAKATLSCPGKMDKQETVLCMLTHRAISLGKHNY